MVGSEKPLRLLFCKKGVKSTKSSKWSRKWSLLATPNFNRCSSYPFLPFFLTKKGRYKRGMVPFKKGKIFEKKGKKRVKSKSTWNFDWKSQNLKFSKIVHTMYPFYPFWQKLKKIMKKINFLSSAIVVGPKQHLGLLFSNKKSKLTKPSKWSWESGRFLCPQYLKASTSYPFYPFF